MPNTPLNPDAIEAMSREIDPDWWQIIDGYPDEIRVPHYRKTALDKAERFARAYLTADQPVVTGEQINRAGWTCDGIHEPGSYATCEDCRGACDDLASFYNQMRITPNASGPWTYRPEVKG